MSAMAAAEGWTGDLPAHLAGKVMTVEGPIDPGELGVTITHEHVFLQEASWLMPATDPGIAALVDEPVSLESLWWLRRFPSSSRDNLVLDDEETARRELGYYAADGGRTIVDVTPTGLIRDRAALRRVALATGVRIVASTGYYAYVSRPEGFDERTVEDLADEFVRDVVVGYPGTDIRAGIIGELAIEGGPQRDEGGMPWGIRSIGELGVGDEKLLRAAARAQARSGAAITIHPPAAAIRGVGASPVIHGILDILADEGADLRRVVLGHLDRDRWETVESLASLGARGPYLEFDQWGYEGIIQESWVFPSDDDRIRLTRGLLAEGFADRLLWSHDVCEKRMWRRFGGQGYSHVLRFIVPVLRAQGVPQETIDQILIGNPARLLPLRPHPRQRAEGETTQ
jgi:phosphotriesterase-related protein